MWRTAVFPAFPARPKIKRLHLVGKIENHHSDFFIFIQYTVVSSLSVVDELVIRFAPGRTNFEN
jgi:hypothetical protein